MKHPVLLAICTLLFQYYSFQAILSNQYSVEIQVILGLNFGLVSGVIAGKFVNWGLKSRNE